MWPFCTPDTIKSSFWKYSFGVGKGTEPLLWLICKESTCQVRDLGMIPGLRRSTGEGNGNPLQYSCPENPMDRGICGLHYIGLHRIEHDRVTKSSSNKGTDDLNLSVWLLAMPQTPLYLMRVISRMWIFLSNNSKMAVWGGLTNSCENKRSQKQRRKKRYTHLNAEFKRIARRNTKAFLSYQCKEIEENNRMEGLEISSRKLYIPSFIQRWTQ